jgi:hypothetical protein
VLINFLVGPEFALAHLLPGNGLPRHDSRREARSGVVTG